MLSNAVQAGKTVVQRYCKEGRPEVFYVEAGRLSFKLSNECPRYFSVSGCFENKLQQTQLALTEYASKPLK